MTDDTHARCQMTQPGGEHPSIVVLRAEDRHVHIGLPAVPRGGAVKHPGGPTFHKSRHQRLVGRQQYIGGSL
jgi:hypothetical protein